MSPALDDHPGPEFAAALGHNNAVHTDRPFLDEDLGEAARFDQATQFECIREPDIGITKRETVFHTG